MGRNCHGEIRFVEKKIRKIWRKIFMASTNKTALGLNQWGAADKPVREDFNKDNEILDREIGKLKENLGQQYFSPIPPVTLTADWQQVLTMTLPAGAYILYAQAVLTNGEICISQDGARHTVGRNFTNDDVTTLAISSCYSAVPTTISVLAMSYTGCRIDGNGLYHYLKVVKII